MSEFLNSLFEAQFKFHIQQLSKPKIYYMMLFVLKEDNIVDFYWMSPA